MTTLAIPRTTDHLALCERLYDRFASIAEVKHYPGILAIYALVRTAQIGGNALLMQRCRTILARFPGELAHGRYNFASYRIGGIARAYLHMIGEQPRAAALVREYAEEAMRAPRTSEGIVTWPRQPDEDRVWIDAAMAVTPYLVFAGRAFDEPRYTDEAVKQTLLMYDVLRDASNGLLHQCRHFGSAGPVSADHWGRGNGWGIFALTELLRTLDHDSPHLEAVTRCFTDHCRALLPHQSPRGLWRQEIPMPEAWEESSGSGLILYAFGVGLEHGVLDRGEFGRAFEHGIVGLRRHCIHNDGSTEMSCHGCLCPGEGQTKGSVQAYVTQRTSFHNEPHSFGTLMLALCAAHQLGLPPTPVIK